MEEGIDTSVWLARGELAITTQRLEKGDIKQFERRGERGVKSFSWLPDELHDLDIITDENLYTAEVLKRIQSVHSRFVDPSVLVGIVKVQNSNPQQIPSDDLFRALMHGLYREGYNVRSKMLVAPLDKLKWYFIRDLNVNKELEPFRWEQMKYHARNRKQQVQDCYAAAREKIEQLLEKWD